MSELFASLPFVIAVMVALLVPLAAMLQYRLASRVSPDTRVILLLMLMALGAMLSIGFTTRNLGESQLLATSAREAYEDSAGGFAASRLFSALVVGAGFIEIVRGWLRARGAKIKDPALPVLLAFLGLYVGTVVIQGVFSEVRSFSYKNLYPLIALLAVYYQRVENLPRVINAVKLCIGVLMVSSLVVMAVKPDFVLQRPAASVLPGISFRFFGLTSDPNTVGPIALLGIVLELAYPSRFLLRWVLLAACAVSFVLAQSKTAWAAGVMMIPLVILPLAMVPGAKDKRSQDNFVRSASALLIAIALAVGLVAALSQFDLFEFLNRKVAGFDTLVGRTRIWQITLDAWKDNVLFGYGAEIWGMERRIKFNMLYVGMAHNQFVQSLGESGLVGLLLLLAYLGVLLRVALKWFVPSRGVMLAILMLILARCITEAPMRATELLSWPLLTHLVLLIMACHYMRRVAVSPVAPASAWTVESRGSARPSPTTSRAKAN